ncbi:MAG: biotin--[acetyl-CoA-carboxylase] ligase [Planctomycetota bacterium]|jgi:BirA family biotin operon repressor/biotin-[acetyl-CoA-carboxylase] ligase
MQRTDLLDPDKIRVNLRTKRIGLRVLVYKSTSSTNDVAAEYASNTDNDGFAIFAEEQTGGRGRAGTRWLSGRADSVLCSILLIDCKVNAELLSLVSAVAVAEAIGKIGDGEARIKWPNDVRLNNKKVAGILLESKKVSGRVAYIVGIGINCHQKKGAFPPELEDAATSIDIESRSTIDRTTLAKRLLISMDHWLEVAEKHPNKVMDRWRKLSSLFGRRVTVVFNGKTFTGNCIGIDPEKGLILQLERGGVRMFDAAHTTIAK